MEHEVRFKIILENPISGVVFGLQKGTGNNYETIQRQVSATKNMLFEGSLKVKTVENRPPVFLGPFAQGPATARFIYIDIGVCAGQKESSWTRRLKIPLYGIQQEMIEQALSDATLIMTTKVPATGKDGGPNCATVKPFGGWHLTSKSSV